MAVLKYKLIANHNIMHPLLLGNLAVLKYKLIANHN